MCDEPWRGVVRRVTLVSGSATRGHDGAEPIAAIERNRGAAGAGTRGRGLAREARHRGLQRRARRTRASPWPIADAITSTSLRAPATRRGPAPPASRACPRRPCAEARRARDLSVAVDRWPSRWGRAYPEEMSSSPWARRVRLTPVLAAACAASFLLLACGKADDESPSPNVTNDEAGRDSTVSTTPDAQSDAAYPPPTPSEACAAYVDALCGRAPECNFGAPGDCKTAAAACPDSLFGPGATNTVDGVVACTRQMVSASCDDSKAGRVACLYPGTRTKGSPCVYGSECGSQKCTAPAPNGCGTCLGLRAAASGCPTSTETCGPGSVCPTDAGGCVPIPAAEAARARGNLPGGRRRRLPAGLPVPDQYRQRGGRQVHRVAHRRAALPVRGGAARHLPERMRLRASVHRSLCSDGDAHEARRSRSLVQRSADCDAAFYCVNPGPQATQAQVGSGGPCTPPHGARDRSRPRTSRYAIRRERVPTSQAGRTALRHRPQERRRHRPEQRDSRTHRAVRQRARRCQVRPAESAARRSLQRHIPALRRPLPVRRTGGRGHVPAPRVLARRRARADATVSDRPPISNRSPRSVPEEISFEHAPQRAARCFGWKSGGRPSSPTRTSSSMIARPRRTARARRRARAT